MRTINVLFTAGLACCIMLAACAKKESAFSVHTRTFEKLFATGPESVKMQAEKVGTEIKATQYNEAIASLDAMRDSPLLSKEQKEALETMVTHLRVAAASQQAKCDFDGLRQAQSPGK